MSTIAVFFDYTCPFCLRGHELLAELIPQYPQLAIEWHPCEAHPRPERHGRHSDLCARGMFFALEQGADLMEYHRIIYRAAVTDGADIEDPRVVAGLTEGLLDSRLLCQALSDGRYGDRLLENNRLAWEEYQFPAVPSYYMDGKLLKAIGGVGVTQQGLTEFLDTAR